MAPPLNTTTPPLPSREGGRGRGGDARIKTSGQPVNHPLPNPSPVKGEGLKVCAIGGREWSGWNRTTTQYNRIPLSLAGEGPGERGVSLVKHHNHLMMR